VAISTAPTAVTNLLAAIGAQSTITTPDGYAVAVLRGMPPEQLPLDEAVMIAEVKGRALQRFEMVGGGGLGYLREDYVIPVEVRVMRGGDLAVDVETRAWALVAAVESAIRADLTLGGAVLESWPETADMLDEWVTAPRIGRRASATVNVHCWAVI
jgi:hypothetical protein